MLFCNAQPNLTVSNLSEPYGHSRWIVYQIVSDANSELLQKFTEKKKDKIEYIKFSNYLVIRKHYVPNSIFLFFSDFF